MESFVGEPFHPWQLAVVAVAGQCYSASFAAFSAAVAATLVPVGCSSLASVDHSSLELPA